MGETYSRQRRPSWMEDPELEDAKDLPDRPQNPRAGPEKKADHGGVVPKKEKSVKLKAAAASPCDRDDIPPCRRNSSEPAVAVNTCTSPRPGGGSLDSRPCTPHPAKQPEMSPASDPRSPRGPSETET